MAGVNTDLSIVQRPGTILNVSWVAVPNPDPGENDTPGHAERLAVRLAGRRCTVNLIPFNPVDESGFGRPTPEAVARFHRLLTQHGIVATVRWSRGVESDAACGQLRVRRA